VGPELTCDSAAACLDHRRSIERGPQRLARVDVAERSVPVVQRDVVDAGAGDGDELIAVVVVGGLDDRSGRSAVHDRVRAAQYLTADDVRVAADLYVDLVQERRAAVGLWIPGRVAHERRRFTRLVPDSQDSASAVSLKHVLTRRDEIGRSILGWLVPIERAGELFRHRGRQWQ
jgi:hypothetical protein